MFQNLKITSSLVLSALFLLVTSHESHASIQSEQANQQINFNNSYLPNYKVNTIDSEQAPVKLAWSWGHFTRTHLCLKKYGPYAKTYMIPYCINYRAKKSMLAKARITAAIKAAAAKAEADRLAAEKAEQDRLAAEKAEQDRLAAEKAEQDRLAAEKAEQDRLAAEKAEQDRLAAAKAEAERLAAEAAAKAEAERLAAEAAAKAEAERLAAEAVAKAEAERLAAEAAAKAEAAKVGGIPGAVPVLGIPGAAAAELTGVNYGCGNPIINSHEYCLNNWSKKPWQHCLDWARGKTNPQSQEFERTKCQCQHGEGMKWTGTGSGPGTDSFKDNCVQWSGETVYLDGVADKGGGPPPTGKTEGDNKKVVAENEGIRDTRECKPIMDKHDPYGTFVCFDKPRCEKEGYTWMSFDPHSSGERLGCSIESRGILAMRAAILLKEFSGNRELCSRESAWQSHCGSRLDGTMADLAPCFALNDMPDNFEGLTLRELGIWQDNSYQCQTAMPLCKAGLKADNKTRAERVREAVLKFNTESIDGASALLAITKGEYEAALTGFADLGTGGGYSCATDTGSFVATSVNSLADQDSGERPTLDGLANATKSCLSMMTGGATDHIIRVAQLFGVLLAREPKCQFNTDVSSSGDSLSHFKMYDFGDGGMFPHSFFLEENVATGLKEGVQDCMKRFVSGERQNFYCTPVSKRYKETVFAKEECPKQNKNWEVLSDCGVFDIILNGPIVEGNLYTWWPLQEGAAHPWANKEGSCTSYDSEGVCVGPDKCAQNPWGMSKNQRDECINADSMVGIIQAYKNVGESRCDHPSVHCYSDSRVSNIKSIEALGNPNSPPNETVESLMDDRHDNKFLSHDFAGFRVEFDKPMIVNGIQFRTANDAPERDPTLVKIVGYPEGDILTGPAHLAITDNATRHAYTGIQAYDLIGNALSNRSANHFINSTPYKFYEVEIIETRDHPKTFQIEAVEFYYRAGGPLSDKDKRAQEKEERARGEGDWGPARGDNCLALCEAMHSRGQALSLPCNESRLDQLLSMEYCEIGKSSGR